MGQRARAYRFRTTRLGLELLEDRRVLTGLGGSLFQLPALPALVPPAPAGVTELIQVPVLETGTDMLLNEPLQSLAPLLENALPSLGVSAQVGLETGGAGFLPALSVNIDVAVGPALGGLLPGVALAADVALEPAGPGLLPDLNLDIEAAIDPVAGGLLPGLELDAEVGVDSGDAGILPNLQIGVVVTPPLDGVLPVVEIEIEVPPIAEIPGDPGPGPDIGSDVGVGLFLEGTQPPSKLAAVPGSTPDTMPVPPESFAYLDLASDTEEVVADDDQKEEAENGANGSLDSDALRLLLALADSSNAVTGEDSPAAVAAPRPMVGVAAADPDSAEMATPELEVSPAAGELAGTVEATGLESAALEQALQRLLASLHDLAQWLAASGLYPWVLTVLVAAAACELARRNLRRSRAEVITPWLLTGLLTPSE